TGASLSAGSASSTGSCGSLRASGITGVTRSGRFRATPCFIYLNIFHLYKYFKQYSGSSGTERVDCGMAFRATL
ncbi:MAG: hypothetical protein ACRETE_06390, partial [Stenotrophobium sp.]